MTPITSARRVPFLTLLNGSFSVIWSGLGWLWLRRLNSTVLFSRSHLNRRRPAVSRSASTTRMRLRIFFVFFLAASAQAAPMYRVVRIAGPAAIVVEREGVQSEVRFADIEIIDARNAVACLSWTIGSSWVMIENGRVYRSPDALLINDELVRKGFARRTAGSPGFQTPATYLGDLNPEPRAERQARAAPKPAARGGRVARPSSIRRTSAHPRRARAPRR